MFNLFKKKEYANVIVFSLKGSMKDHFNTLIWVRDYLKKTIKVEVNFLNYYDGYNKKTEKIFEKLTANNLQDAEMVYLNFCNDPDKEKDVVIEMMPMDNEVHLLCFINQKYFFEVSSFLQQCSFKHAINYGFLYEVKVKLFSAASYFVNVENANKFVVNFPEVRVSKEKMRCYRQNSGKLLEGVIKDVFKMNVITDKQLQKISGTNFFKLIQTNGLLKEIYPGVYYFEFMDEVMLSEARLLAYKENLVLCP